MDPTRETLDAFIDANYPDADQWDREEAIYWFASDYHSGQASSLYSVLSTSPFNPGPLACGPDAGYASEIYDALISHFT